MTESLKKNGEEMRARKGAPRDIGRRLRRRRLPEERLHEIIQMKNLSHKSFQPTTAITIVI